MAIKSLLILNQVVMFVQSERIKYINIKIFGSGDMRFVLDRFEGEYAVCENNRKEILNINKDKIPAEAKEGDVLKIGSNEITIDREETEKRKREVEKLMEDLWE